MQSTAQYHREGQWNNMALFQSIEKDQLSTVSPVLRRDLDLANT